MLVHDALDTLIGQEGLGAAPVWTMTFLPALLFGGMIEMRSMATGNKKLREVWGGKGVQQQENEQLGARQVRIWRAPSQDLARQLPLG